MQLDKPRWTASQLFMWTFRSLLKNLSGLLILITWLGGVVLAKGFWSTAFSIFIPPWAWYLVVEKIMMHFGLT